MGLEDGDVVQGRPGRFLRSLDASYIDFESLSFYPLGAWTCSIVILAPTGAAEIMGDSCYEAGRLIQLLQDSLVCLSVQVIRLCKMNTFTRLIKRFRFSPMPEVS